MWETLFGKMVLMQRGSPLFEKLGKLCGEPPFVKNNQHYVGNPSLKNSPLFEQVGKLCGEPPFVKNNPHYVDNPFWKNDPHAAWEPPF